MLNLALGSSEEAQDHRQSETVLNRDLNQRATLGVASDMVVYTAPGAAVHCPGSGGATALFLPRLLVWELALAVTGQSIAIGVAVPPPVISRA